MDRDFLREKYETIARLPQRTEVCRQYKLHADVAVSRYESSGWRSSRSMWVTQVSLFTARPGFPDFVEENTEPMRVIVEKTQEKVYQDTVDGPRQLLVLGIRDGVAVVQFKTDSMCAQSFLAVNVVSGLVTSVFISDMYTIDASPEAYISPDKSTFLLHKKYSRFLYQLEMKYSDVRKTYRFDYDVMLIAYDPRFGCSRIAMYVRGAHGYSIQLYDLKRMQILCAKRTFFAVISGLTFSACGGFLISVGLSDYGFVSFLRSDTLDQSRTYFNQFSPHYLITLSQTGQHVAMLDRNDRVEVYRAPVKIDLFEQCRAEIRKVVKSEDVEHLPLPGRLKSFLRFEPLYE